jgi:hypothetical protein
VAAIGLQAPGIRLNGAPNVSGVPNIARNDVEHVIPPSNPVGHNSHIGVEAGNRRSGVTNETKARASEELWHLGVGDRLVSVSEPAPIVLSGPFVINLRTSPTPIGGIANALQRFKEAHVYQLERQYEGRPQFLLRVGVIDTELEADALLASICEEYPDAFKASAADDDLKAIAARERILKARPAARKAGHARAEPRTAAPHPPAAAAPVPTAQRVGFHWNIDEVLPELGARLYSASATASIPDPTPTPAAQEAEPSPQIQPAPEIQLPPDIESAPEAAFSSEIDVPPEIESRAAVESPPQIELLQEAELSPAAPVPVSVVEIALADALDADPNAVTDQLEAPVFTFETPQLEPAELPAPAVQGHAAEVPVLEPEPTAISLTEVAGDPAPALESEPAPESEPAAQIDRTETVRALTHLELEDEQSSRWFAIQLASAEKEFDPSDVPNLSIFAEYRLYAVRELDQERPLHALRLGFFSSETAAAAVAGYLAAYFDAPLIKRVSLAEHERFEEQRVTARKDVGAADGHVAIELAGPAPSPLRQAYERLAAQRKHIRPKESSLWSRLIPTWKS